MLEFFNDRYTKTLKFYDYFYHNIPAFVVTLICSKKQRHSYNTE